MTYDFYTKFARILNSNQSRSIVVTGNVDDLLWDGNSYVPLLQFLVNKTKPANAIQLVYELNSTIRVNGTLAEQQAVKEKLMKAWSQWKLGMSIEDFRLKNLNKDLKREGPSEADKIERDFTNLWLKSVENPNIALEFLRQLCMCSRSVLSEPIHIFLEGVDMLLPNVKEEALASNGDLLRRICIVHDWMSEPAFVNGKDSVIMLTESRSLIFSKITKMPQIIEVDVESPNRDSRLHYLKHTARQLEPKASPEDLEQKWSYESLSANTAGLSLYALRQLMMGAIYSGKPLTVDDVIGKVQDFIKSQLGEDVVKFTKPTHRLTDVRGFTQVKRFIADVIIPRFKATGKDALVGCAIGGPIGGGKTYVWEAVGAELDMVCMELKNLRSQWYGQTDVILERLERLLMALERALISIDEADTTFGGLGKDVHETERRLTGRIQSMMSNPKLKGKIKWLLMTARINLLSPDMRRPGRAGDIIVPMLDPEGDDRIDFIKWAMPFPVRNSVIEELNTLLAPDYSAGAFTALQSHLEANKEYILATDGGVDGSVVPNSDLHCESIRQRIVQQVNELIPSDISEQREYQKLQALINCTRRSLIPKTEIIKVSEKCDISEARRAWKSRIRELESLGYQ